MKMYDSAEGTIPALPNGGAGAAILVPSDGIWFANGQRMVAENPNAEVQTISEAGQVLADWIDVEPGCVWPVETAVGVYRAWRGKCRGFYSNLSTQQAIRQYLGQIQIDPNEPEWFDADWDNVDRIDPGDTETQFESLPTYDVSEIPDPPPIVVAPSFGDNMLLNDPQTGGVWVCDETGAVDSYDGAPYLGGSNGAKFETAGKPCVGIAHFYDASGAGYVTCHDWGAAGEAGGQDRYRRYRFPRSGSGK